LIVTSNGRFSLGGDLRESIVATHVASWRDRGAEQGGNDVRDEFVLTEKRGQAFVITLNRSEVYNAFNRQQAEQLAAAIDRLEDDPDIRVGILTGAGGVFSSGSDLRAAAAGESTVVPPRGLYGMLDDPPRKPMIAAVEGYAVGGGLELALACDLIVASETAVFGIPEVRRGVFAGAGALIRLPQRIPYFHAMELALTGTLVKAERAAELGLVNRLVPAARALDTALALAAEVIESAPVAVLASKEALQRSLDLHEDEAWALQRELQQHVMASEDSREGIAAFNEKRQPIWRGR
jgi:enoyl-CoA hydratase